MDTINQLAIVLGCLISYIVAQGLLGLFSHDVTWRWMFGLELVPILFFVIYLLFVPRNPRWLAENGRSEEALTVLTRIQCSEAAQRELDEMDDCVRSKLCGSRKSFGPAFALPC